jgi:ribosome maturation factor RimP
MAPAELQKLIEDRIAKLDVHLIDVVIRGEGGGKGIEVFVDSEKGVTTETCSEVSREIGGLIEAADVVRGAYRLTVSSPGIDRPLKYSWQYAKHVGRRIQLKVRGPGGIREATGMLESHDDHSVVVLSGANSAPESFPYSDIIEARVKAPW